MPRDERQRSLLPWPSLAPMPEKDDHCGSVNTLDQGHRLVSYSCTYAKGHQGPCRDQYGNEWKRARELIREAREDNADRGD